MLASLKVKDYMTVNKCTFSTDMDILSAIHHMLESKISGAPVIDNHGNMVGFLSEKDCMKVALNAGYQQSGAAGRVSEFMSHGVDIIDIETPIIEVAELFLKGSFKLFPVVMDNRLVGTITRQNILSALSYISSPESTHKPSKQPAKQSVHS
ncbi:MAG: CBS domain-containing protein [Pseudomonadota bacterium]|nr:CBS domain-containing protein [Pseudomonadota bacterium]MDO7666922.1 CBS domain-containing protein [Pseudomonadota bacterium]MDO7710586.1 CBS domain-containing protein [Pseudomonadota bacterium]